jgi:hypothetical protein
VEEIRQNQGKALGTRRAGVFAWIVALFRGRKLDPFAERLAIWEGTPDEKPGYYRLTFTREDGEAFSCIVDARPAQALSNDLLRAAARMTLRTRGDASGAVEVATGQGFDYEKSRAEYEKGVLERTKGTP